jgi:hypothetical protein
MIETMFPLYYARGWTDWEPNPVIVRLQNEFIRLRIAVFDTIIRHFFLPLAQQPHAGQGRLIRKFSRSHSVAQHSRYDSSGRGIGPSQRPPSENTQLAQETEIHSPGGNSDNTQLSQEKEIHAPGGIRTRNPSKSSAANARFRPLGLYDRYNERSLFLNADASFIINSVP